MRWCPSVTKRMCWCGLRAGGAGDGARWEEIEAGHGLGVGDVHCQALALVHKVLA